MPGRLQLTPFRFARGRFLLIADEPGVAMPSGLTEAERDIVRHLRAGSSNEQIARARGTSERTVAKQVSALLRKLGVGSRVEVALWDER
jgi:DNA-binding NarL/FixJ family response regulator